MPHSVPKDPRKSGGNNRITTDDHADITVAGMASLDWQMKISGFSIIVLGGNYLQHA